MKRSPLAPAFTHGACLLRALYGKVLPAGLAGNSNPGLWASQAAASAPGLSVAWSAFFASALPIPPDPQFTAHTQSCCCRCSAPPPGQQLRLCHQSSISATAPETAGSSDLLARSCVILFLPLTTSSFLLSYPSVGHSQGSASPANLHRQQPLHFPPLLDSYRRLTNYSQWPSPSRTDGPTLRRMYSPDSLVASPSCICSLSRQRRCSIIVITNTMSSSTPQNTPLNNAPISSHAQQPGVASIKEGELRQPR